MATPCNYMSLYLIEAVEQELIVIWKLQGGVNDKDIFGFFVGVIITTGHATCTDILLSVSS